MREIKLGSACRGPTCCRASARAPWAKQRMRDNARTPAPSILVSRDTCPPWLGATHRTARQQAPWPSMACLCCAAQRRARHARPSAAPRVLPWSAACAASARHGPRGSKSMLASFGKACAPWHQPRESHARQAPSHECGTARQGPSMALRCLARLVFACPAPRAEHGTGHARSFVAPYAKCSPCWCIQAHAMLV